MKRKKLWITLSVVCVVILAFGLIFGLAFRLKTVNVEFLSREEVSRLEPGIAEKVKGDGEFAYGKNILFFNPQESIDKIERLNPYIKVERAVRVFPNVLNIYISERTPEYRIQNTDNSLEWYIVDSEFKVLDKVSTADITQNEYFELTTEIDPESFTIKDYYNGDFLTITNGYDELLNEISEGIYERTIDSSSACQITIEKVEGDFEFVITMRNSTAYDGKGCRIIIRGKSDLTDKVFKAITIFEQETQSKPELNDNQNSIIVEVVNGKLVGRFVPGQG